MLVAPKLALLGLAGLVGASSNGACTNTDLQVGFDLYVYDQHYCYTDSGDKIYSGNPTSCYGCQNFSSKIAKHLLSFAFTARQGQRLLLYKDTDCGGTVLGNQTGNWLKPVTSSAGQGSQSFNVCKH